MAAVLRHLSPKGPLLVLGDFNENLDGLAIRDLLLRGFSAPCARRPCGPTFPGPALPWPAFATIDHIFGREVAFEDARTVREGGSDHFPVVADVWIAPQQ